MLLILEYLGGIESFMAQSKLSMPLGILEYLGGIESQHSVTGL